MNHFIDLYDEKNFYSSDEWSEIKFLYNDEEIDPKKSFIPRYINIDLIKAISIPETNEKICKIQLLFCDKSYIDIIFNNENKEKREQDLEKFINYILYLNP